MTGGAVGRIARWLDVRLLAPEATTAERLVCYGSAVVGAAVAVVLGVRQQVGALALVVIGLVAFDLIGGAVVNATTAAKRWWHRPGRTAKHHLRFVAVHVQPLLLALVVPGFGWLDAAAVYGAALGGAAVVVVAPSRLARPAAFAVTVLAVTLLTSLVSIPMVVGWFAPVLLIKLLLAHLLPEEARAH